jgi:hypothetical protein
VEWHWCHNGPVGVSPGMLRLTESGSRHRTIIHSGDADWSAHFNISDASRFNPISLVSESLLDGPAIATTSAVSHSAATMSKSVRPLFWPFSFNSANSLRSPTNTSSAPFPSGPKTVSVQTASSKISSSRAQKRPSPPSPPQLALPHQLSTREPSSRTRTRYIVFWTTAMH